jgi:PEGA domain
LLRRLCFLSVILLVIPTASFAKPKKKTFNNSPQEVFQAALKTARERHVVTNVDEKNLMMTFETGVSMVSYGFIANASVEPEGDGKSTLTINVQHKNNGKNASFSFNAGDRMADKFYEQVTQELTNKSAQKVAEKPETPHVEVPAKPAVEEPKELGTVTISSTPDGADVSVDGAFVGNAPASIKLKPGKHSIGVTQTGFNPWTRELTIMAGSESKLNATLSKQQ